MKILLELLQRLLLPLHPRCCWKLSAKVPVLIIVILGTSSEVLYVE